MKGILKLNFLSMRGMLYVCVFLWKLYIKTEARALNFGGQYDRTESIPTANGHFLPCLCSLRGDSQASGPQGIQREARPWTGGGGEPLGWLILPVLALEEQGDRGCTEVPKEQDKQRPRHTEGSSQGPGLVICFRKFSNK